MNVWELPVIVSGAFAVISMIREEPASKGDVELHDNEVRPPTEHEKPFPEPLNGRICEGNSTRTLVFAPAVPVFFAVSEYRIDSPARTGEISRVLLVTLCRTLTENSADAWSGTAVESIAVRMTAAANN